MNYGRTSIISFLSQLVMTFAGFVGTVVLTRTLGADRYGTYVLVLTLLTWVMIAGDLGLDAAIKKRLSEVDTGGYLAAGVLGKLALYAAVATCLWLGRSSVNAYLGMEATEALIVLLGGQLLLRFVRHVLEGEHHVDVSSVLQPIEWGGRSIVQITLVLAGFGLAGAFWGHVVGALVAALIGLRYVSSGLHLPSRSDFASLRSYAQFSWLGSIKGSAFVTMDTLVLGFFVTSGTVAVYDVAWGLASLFSLFGIAIATTLFPEMSKISSEGNHQEVARLLRISLVYAGLLVIPGLVGSAILGDLVLTVYGSDFQSGYEILLLLTFARLVYSYEKQFVSTIDAVDRPELTFRSNVLFVGSNITLNVLLIPSLGWYGAAIATITSAALGLVVGYRYATTVIDVTIPYAEIGKQIIAAGVMAAVVFPGRVLLPETLPVSIVLAAVGAAVYFVILVRLSEEFRTTVHNNLPASLARFV